MALMKLCSLSSYVEFSLTAAVSRALIWHLITSMIFIILLKISGLRLVPDNVFQFFEQNNILSQLPGMTHLVQLSLSVGAAVLFTFVFTIRNLNRITNLKRQDNRSLTMIGYVGSLNFAKKMVTLIGLPLCSVIAKM